MRIKLKTEQLDELKHQLPFEVVLEQARDVRGFLEILGHHMPWDDMGLTKFGDPVKKPNRVAFSVEPTDDGYLCDIHPAFACYVSGMLNHNKNSRQ